MKFENEAEIRAFVQRFEQCEMALREFGHAAHVVVATVFVCDDAEAALRRMREGLLRFTAHYEKTGVYKEDVTREWIERLRGYVNESSDRNLVDVVNRAVEEFGSKRARPASPVR